MYDKRYVAIGDKVAFGYNGYNRHGKVVKANDATMTITYLSKDPSDGCEVKKIKSFKWIGIYGLQTVTMA